VRNPAGRPKIQKQLSNRENSTFRQKTHASKKHGRSQSAILKTENTVGIESESAQVVRKGHISWL
jgi:hypothetical protein